MLLDVMGNSTAVFNTALYSVPRSKLANLCNVETSTTDCHLKNLVIFLPWLGIST